MLANGTSTVILAEPAPAITIAVLELAVDPAIMPTEATVPEIGAVSTDAVRFCCAVVSAVCAVITAASSVSAWPAEFWVEFVPPDEPDPVPVAADVPVVPEREPVLEFELDDVPVPVEELPEAPREPLPDEPLPDEPLPDEPLPDVAALACSANAFDSETANLEADA
ncbi:MAG: hypothetical protein JWN95_3619 [Frankiales bacterium]|nr:hypothetical protein [Frankiales bacterium]